MADHPETADYPDDYDYRSARPGEAGNDTVIIRPRVGVDARSLARWLESNFQRPGTCDGGASESKDYRVRGGNPLVNADIRTTAPGPMTDARAESAEQRLREAVEALRYYAEWDDGRRDEGRRARLFLASLEAPALEGENKKEGDK